MVARFFNSGLSNEELMKRAFRIKPLVPSIDPDLRIPDDLRKEFSKMLFTSPTDLEIGTVEDGLKMEDCPADMLKPVRTLPVTLHARGEGKLMPIISELLAGVPADLLYTVSAFSIEKDKAQPLDANGRQRALLTFYEGELPKKIKDQYIIHDGKAYSPDWRLLEKLDRIPVLKQIKIKGPGA